MLRRGLLLSGGVGAAYAFTQSRTDDGRRSLVLGLSQADAMLRPTLAAVLPHDAFVCLYSASRGPFIKVLSGESSTSTAAALPSSAVVRSMGLAFRNDLGNAAGLDKDGALLDFNYALGAGFAVVGTVLSESHTGNVFSFLGGLWSGNAWTPLPLSGAALNSLGLPSKGVDAALANIAAFRERHGVRPQCAAREAADAPGGSGGPAFPIGVSIMGHPAHGADAKRKLDGVVRPTACPPAAAMLNTLLAIATLPTPRLS